MKHKIKQYKGIGLYYKEEDGRIYFKFEGQERCTKYVFEAERIIDEPVWEDCDLKGYFLKGYFIDDKFIGLAKAKRKDIKTGQPDWMFKGEFDTDYEKPNVMLDNKVFLKNKVNDNIYKEWRKQRDKYIIEKRKMNNIVKKLK